MWFFWIYPTIVGTTQEITHGDPVHNPLISTPIIMLVTVLGIAGIVLFILGAKNWFLELNGERIWKIVFKLSFLLLGFSGILLFLYL